MPLNSKNRFTFDTFYWHVNMGLFLVFRGISRFMISNVQFGVQILLHIFLKKNSGNGGLFMRFQCKNEAYWDGTLMSCEHFTNWNSWGWEWDAGAEREICVGDIMCGSPILCCSLHIVFHEKDL